MDTVDRLNQIDDQYPRRSNMPTDIKAEYDRLNIEFVGQVLESRVVDHGSIHRYLDKGEKNGA